MTVRGRLVEGLVGAIGLVVFAAAMIRVTAVRPVWYDELFTLSLSRIGNPTDLWNALAAGVDLNPPVSYLATHASIELLGESGWALRLPAVAGGLAALVALYLFGRHRGGPAAGALVAAAGLLSPAIWAYFLEARPYGLAVGFAATALLCWQRAADATGPARVRWLLGLAAAVTLGSATHYYFLLPVGGIAVGEALRWALRRRIDFAVAAALALAGVVPLALAPLWRGASRDYALGFWAKTGVTREALGKPYALYFSGDVLPAFGCAAAIVAIGAFAGRRTGLSTGAIRFPPWEVAAAAAWSIGPVVGLGLGAAATGAFHPRYVVPMEPGIGILAAIALLRVPRCPRAALLAAAGVLAFLGPFGQWFAVYRFFADERRDSATLVAFLANNAGDRRVVMESHLAFALAWHDGAAAGVRPIYATDPTAARARTGSDTIELGLLKLQRVTAVPLSDPAAIAAAVTGGEPVFYFGPASSPAAEGLRSRGLEFQLVAEGPLGELYRLHGKP